MSDAPKRIWIDRVWGRHPEDWGFFIGANLTKKQKAGKVEYIRADIVQALTAERDRFRVALQLYAEPCDATETSPCGYEGNMCCRTARAALKGETP